MRKKYYRALSPQVPNPKGQVTLGATMPKEMADEIDGLAKVSGMTRNRYLLALCEDAITRHRRFTIQRAQFIEIPSNPEPLQPYALNEPPPPYGVAPPPANRGKGR